MPKASKLLLGVPPWVEILHTYPFLHGWRLLLLQGPHGGGRGGVSRGPGIRLVHAFLPFSLGLLASRLGAVFLPQKAAVAYQGGSIVQNCQGTVIIKLLGSLIIAFNFSRQCNPLLMAPRAGCLPVPHGVYAMGGKSQLPIWEFLPSPCFCSPAQV